MSGLPAAVAHPRAVPAPALFHNVRRHLPAVAARLKAMRLDGTLAPRWRTEGDRTVVTVTLTLDPQSDSILEDERRAVAEAREILIDVGCYVDCKGTTLTIAGYYGSAVAA
jgi:hypothetical protein